MDLKRILTAVIGAPLVIALIILGTSPIINFVIMIIAVLCLIEYFRVISNICNPIKWVGYLCTVIIFLVSILPMVNIYTIILYSIPIILLILFLHIILTDMKINFKDVAYTFLGIVYIVGFIMFLGLITVTENGKWMLAFILLIAWATDVFAYLAGKNFGKHKFSKVSPKKTIEGCVTGTVAAVVTGIIYTMILNNIGILNIQPLFYLYVGLITLCLSIISQIGDFTASSIKRFANAKDYGNILPGHGGMLDRIDSLIFMAPFAYMLINYFNI